MDNPWLDLPKQTPLIALCDLGVVSNPSYNLDGLRFDAFPEPFGGSINTARVIFCLLYLD